MNDETFWAVIWALVATVVITLILSICLYSNLTNTKIADMTKNGSDPMAAACALSAPRDMVCMNYLSLTARTEK